MLTWIKNNLYHRLWAWVGAVWYRFPSRRLHVVGITGTKGKTTVVELIGFILEQAGRRIAVSSSTRNGGSAMTMPGRSFLQRFLRRAVDDGCYYAVIEVTSQGVLQYRHRFIDWSAAIFTNLAPEHLEAHGGWEAYREAKLDFFRYAARRFKNYKNKLFFINKDDPHAQSFIEAAQGGQIILFNKSDLSSPVLPGEFNQYNIGAAMAFARSQGIDEEVIRRAVADFPGVPGRMEFIQREPFAVVIDYAHTPDSLREVYKTLISNYKLQITNLKFICVLGSAGGGRDQWKRPEMGKIAAQYCDEIILTNEDPYDESPQEIIEQIASGFPIIHDSKFMIHKILDRREAIKKAVSLAKAGDCVIITGKGSEKWIHVAGGKRIPWSDKEVVMSTISDDRQGW